MISFDNFITAWTGKPVDFDGVYPNQCMDLMHQYAYDCLGITDKSVLARPWAALVYTNFAWDAYFDKIGNTPTGVPQKGDIMLWEEALNYDSSVGHGYGHVSIFVSGDANNFKSFDANWPLGSLPHIQDHNYNHVLGWLRFKDSSVSNTITIPQETFQNLVSKSSKYDDFVNNGFNNADEVKNNLKSKQDTIDNLNQQINDRNADITQLNGQVSSLNAQVLSLQQAKDSLETQAKLVPDLQKQNKALSDKVTSYQSAEQTWNRSKAQLQKEIDDLKTNSWKALFRNLFDKIK